MYIYIYIVLEKRVEVSGCCRCCHRMRAVIFTKSGLKKKLTTILTEFKGMMMM